MAAVIRVSAGRPHWRAGCLIPRPQPAFRQPFYRGRRFFDRAVACDASWPGPCLGERHDRPAFQRGHLWSEQRSAQSAAVQPAMDCPDCLTPRPPALSRLFGGLSKFFPSAPREPNRTDAAGTFISCVGNRIPAHAPNTKADAARFLLSNEIWLKKGVDYLSPTSISGLVHCNSVTARSDTKAVCLTDRFLGNRLTVDPRTLTPLVLVRIQVPQPNCFPKSLKSAGLLAFHQVAEACRIRLPQVVPTGPTGTGRKHRCGSSAATDTHLECRS